jgi:hypothetical protein
MNVESAPIRTAKRAAIQQASAVTVRNDSNPVVGTACEQSFDVVLLG